MMMIVMELLVVVVAMELCDVVVGWMEMEMMRDDEGYSIVH